MALRWLWVASPRPKRSRVRDTSRKSENSVIMRIAGRVPPAPTLCPYPAFGRPVRTEFGRPKRPNLGRPIAPALHQTVPRAPPHPPVVPLSPIRGPMASVRLTSYWNERKAHEIGVVPILSGYTLGFWRGREERCQTQFL